MCLPSFFYFFVDLGHDPDPDDDIFLVDLARFGFTLSA